MKHDQLHKSARNLIFQGQSYGSEYKNLPIHDYISIEIMGKTNMANFEWRPL